MKLQEIDPLEELRRLIEKHGSQRAAARILGVHECHVSDMLHARRNISDSMLERLGLRAVVVKK